MTVSPLTVARSRSLSAARKEMTDHQVRHLPVEQDGQIVGLLTERDLLLIESLPGVNPTDVRVEDAMVTEVYTVSATTPLRDVVLEMEKRKIGSAVVVEAGTPVGVFTTTDALRLLRTVLAP